MVFNPPVHCMVELFGRRAMKRAIDVWALKSETLKVVGRLQGGERLVIDKAHGELFIWRVGKLDSMCW